ncbi:MAG: acetyltransferase [Rhodospirillales bacterium]|nr:MAG: acetyltransferase [Rhodospirillales bacterium]
MTGDFPIAILGAGGHGKVLAAALQRAGQTVLGFIDSDATLLGKKILGLPVLGGDEMLDRNECRNWRLVNGIGSVGRPARRREIFERLKSSGFSFVTVIDPSAIVAPEVEIGEGAQILAGAVIQTGAYIGRNCIVNTRASIDHDTVLGAHVHVAPGAVLSGCVIVGDEVHIGTGAAIKQGIRIGSGAVIGVGSAVIHDVPADSLQAGVPARPLFEN